MLLHIVLAIYMQFSSNPHVTCRDSSSTPWVANVSDVFSWSNSDIKKLWETCVFRVLIVVLEIFGEWCGYLLICILPFMCGDVLVRCLLTSKKTSVDCMIVPQASHVWTRTFFGGGKMTCNYLCCVICKNSMFSTKDQQTVQMNKNTWRKNPA